MHDRLSVDVIYGSKTHRVQIPRLVLWESASPEDACLMKSMMPTTRVLVDLSTPTSRL